ncbi:nucleotide exchange factor SIL1 [Paramormyrops kingsleyae]|uniref:Nucleotide exchange factor SIL1 n=1 Tax=Paramormyrops kingsleyae TaxID=1676925 RepID=A0A3B3Q8F0_9TELE|nr:nucleotide exchange factor SIL1 [Paramormyrops kingsleyae]
MSAVFQEQRSGRRVALLTVCILLVRLASANYEKAVSALTVVESVNGDEEAHVDDEVDSEDVEVFQPTSQWQTLRPGQAVPAGSHVRLNLQTGHREAKLDEEVLKYWSDGKRQGIVNTKASSFTTEELKKALKKFKEEGVESLHQDSQKEAELKSQFRPLEELKKDMAQLDLMVETDFQVMSRLVAQLNRSVATVEERVAALLDLEYLVHQVDNARDLVSMGGMKLVIDTLNGTHLQLQESAAFVLGSAVSSNPQVQVSAVEAGALQMLVTLLATDRPISVKKKVLFAISSLLRNFPFAQSHFLKLGGVQALGDLFRAPGSEGLRVRMVTLLYDMIVEKELVSQAGLDTIPDSTHQERLRQYNQVSLLPLLAEQGWCGLVPQLLLTPEHDWREKALRTLLAMSSHCGLAYRQDPGLGHALSALRQQYQELALSEEGLAEEDWYFREILELLDSALLKIH